MNLVSGLYEIEHYQHEISTLGITKNYSEFFSIVIVFKKTPIFH